MTQTCTTCFDRDCPKVGADMPRCEHYVRLSDVEPLPVVEGTLSHRQELLNVYRELDTRLRRVERALCDISRATKGELP